VKAAWHFTKRVANAAHSELGSISAEAVRKSSVGPTTRAKNPIMAAKAKTIQKPFEVRSVSSFRCPQPTD